MPREDFWISISIIQAPPPTTWFSCNQVCGTNWSPKAFLFPGWPSLVFGDNAYLNSPYMAAPFKRDSRGSEDAYNFFHSSTRINIDCAFGMLVHRWAILRKPFPCNISKSKTTDLVTCLCKLHNYCIDQNEGRALESTAIDALELSSRGAVPFDQRGNPQQLMRPGHHFDDVNRNERREFQLQLQRNALNENTILPRDYLHKIVIDKALHRTTLNDH